MGLRTKNKPKKVKPKLVVIDCKSMRLTQYEGKTQKGIAQLNADDEMTLEGIKEVIEEFRKS